MHENKTYRSRPDGPIKVATLIDESAEYETSWGHQKLEGRHYRIGPDGGDQYGCAINEFLATHVEADGGWRKSVDVQAYKCEEVHQVSTVVDGKTEVELSDVPVGFWVVTNPGGEQYAMREPTFLARYQPK